MSLINKKDVVLIAILSAIGLVLTLFIFSPSKDDAAYLEVRQSGKVVMTLPLDNDTTQTIYDNEKKSNTFYIKDGIVSMKHADCSDHTCVRTGSISRTGETIVCLPHRLVLEITGGTPPDAIVR